MDGQRFGVIDAKRVAGEEKYFEGRILHKSGNPPLKRESQSSFIFRDTFSPFPSLSFLAPSCLSFFPHPPSLSLSISLCPLFPYPLQIYPFSFPFCLNEIFLFVFFWVNSWFCLFKITCILHLWRANEPKRGHLYCEIGHLLTNPLPFLYMCPFHNIFFIPKKTTN